MTILLTYFILNRVLQKSYYENTPASHSFNQEISIPKCKVVKNPEFKAYEKDFQQRLKDFVKRVREGGK